VAKGGKGYNILCIVVTFSLVSKRLGEAVELSLALGQRVSLMMGRSLSQALINVLRSSQDGGWAAGLLGDDVSDSLWTTAQPADMQHDVAARLRPVERHSCRRQSSPTSHAQTQKSAWSTLKIADELLTTASGL
jgi:hypothetical protein